MAPRSGGGEVDAAELQLPRPPRNPTHSVADPLPVADINPAVDAFPASASVSASVSESSRVSSTHTTQHPRKLMPSSFLGWHVSAVHPHSATADLPVTAATAAVKLAPVVLLRGDASASHASTISASSTPASVVHDDRLVAAVPLQKHLSLTLDRNPDPVCSDVASSAPASASGFLSQLGERLFVSSSGAAGRSRTGTPQELSRASHHLAPATHSLPQPVESTVVPPTGSEEPTFSLNVDDYQVDKLVGFGSSATVHRALYRPMGWWVAIKMIDLDKFERNQIDELRKELQVMSLCKHPNLLDVKGSFVVDSKLYIVTPFLPAGSCLDIMKTSHPDGLEEPAIAAILKQALSGLEYLHKTGLIHRDVKAGNLLMDSDGTVKLADFGVSSSLLDTGERKGLRRTFVGTPCWIAPEVVQQIGYDHRADIWSFGITSLELAHGRAPFSKFPPMKVLMMTLQNAPPTLDRATAKRKFTKSFKDMIDSCLQKAPTNRPSAEKLLQHAFFRYTKKKSYLVEALLKNLPPVHERPHREPVQKEDAQVTDHSWDFSEIDPPSIDETELTSAEASPSSSAEVLPSDSSFTRSLSPKADLSDDSSSQLTSTADAHIVVDVPQAGPTVQQKKGRFVVDVQVSNSNGPTAHTTANPENAKAENRSRKNSDGLVIDEAPRDGSRPTAATSSAPQEVKIGRFSVKGDSQQGPAVDEETAAAQSKRNDVPSRPNSRPGNEMHSRAGKRDRSLVSMNDGKRTDGKGKRQGATESTSQPPIQTSNTSPSQLPTPVAESLRRGRFEVTSASHIPVTLTDTTAEDDGAGSMIASPPVFLSLTGLPATITFIDPVSMMTEEEGSNRGSPRSGPVSAPAVITRQGPLKAHFSLPPAATGTMSVPSRSLVDQLSQLLTQTEQQRQMLADIIHRSQTASSIDMTASSPRDDFAGAVSPDTHTLQNQVQRLLAENDQLRRENQELRQEMERCRTHETQ